MTNKGQKFVAYITNLSEELGWWVEAELKLGETLTGIKVRLARCLRIVMREKSNG